MQTNRSGLFLIRLLALLAVAFVAAPGVAGDLDRTGLAERAQSDVPGQLAQACPRIYRPVCAFVRGNWRTYGNSCLARNAGARLIRQGACRADERQICCQRGRREFFSTPQSCRRDGGRVVPERFCRQRRCSDQRPVCGWLRGRRHQFANICELRRDGGRFIRYGRCQAPQTCHQASTSRRYPHVQGRSWNPACRAAPPPQRSCHQRGTSRNIPHISGRSWDPACSGASGGTPQRPQAGSPCTTTDRNNITVQGRIFIDKNGFPVCMSDSSGRPRP